MRGAPEIDIDFSGGVNLEAAPYLLEGNQCRNARDVQSSRTGQVRKRNGFSTLATLSGSPASFTGRAHTLYATDVSAPLLLAVGPVSGGEDKIVSISTAGTVTDLTAGGATHDQGVRWSFAQAPVTSDAKGPIFGMNGVDTPQVWDGNTANDFANWTAAAGTLPVTGKGLVYHGNRLWCIEAAEPGRVRYSGITGSSPDMGNWDANGFVDLDPEDGQDLVALVPFGSYLLAFKPRKIHVIYDLVSGANRTLSVEHGTVSPRAAVPTEQGVFFLDESAGVLLTDGETIEPQSSNVDSLIRTAAAFPSTFENAAATYIDQRYYLSLSVAGTVNDLTLEYDLVTGAWWIHSCASNQFALLDPHGTPKLYSANPAATTVQQAFVPALYTDAGVPYRSYVRLPHKVWGEPHIQKRVRQVRVDGQGTWQLGYAMNFVDDFTIDDGEVWETSASDPVLFAPTVSEGVEFAPSPSEGIEFAPTTEAITYRRYYTLGVARAWSFEISSEDSANFELYAMTVALTPRSD